MTIPTFTAYQPPGVYVQDVSGPVAVASGVPPQVMAIVGPALGYRTASQSFRISHTTATQLSFTGVFTTAVSGPPPIAAPVVTKGTTVLTVGTDYTLTVTPDPSGNAALAMTTVLRVNSSSNVSDGDQVTVVYNYADITYYQPQVFADYQSVINSYGQPFLSTVPTAPGASQVANPLTLGCLIAFQNGANTVIAVALNAGDGNLQAQLKAAYTKLANNYSVTIVVPVLTDDLTPPSGSVAAYAQTLAGDLNTACVADSNNGYPQIGFFGLPRNYLESDVSIEVLTASLASERLVLVYPEIVILYNSITGQTFNASGCYLAVALGATLSSLPADTGLTGQQLTGFNGLTQAEVSAMTPSFMNAIAAGGGCVVTQNWRGQLICRHGLTTDITGINRSEISMVRQTDTLMVAVQLGLQDTGLIGSPITADTVATVQAAVTGILEQSIANQVIVDFTNLVVQQQVYPSGNPTVIAVSFQYLPAWPLNYITVTMAIDLSNGGVTVQSNQNAGTNG